MKQFLVRFCPVALILAIIYSCSDLGNEPRGKPFLEVTPSVEFESVVVGDSTDTTLVILNSGELTLVVFEVNLSGPDAGDFQVLTDLEMMELAPGSDTTFGLRFKPSSEGTKSAILTIQINDPDAELTTVRLSGIAAKLESIAIISAKDNTLYEHSAGLFSNGVGEHIFAGKTASGLIRRGLLGFDIAGSVPAGATIDSVTLTLNMSRTQAPVQAIELHRVLSNWGEGTSDSPFNEGGGTQSTAGDATWIHTFFDTSFWTNPGGDFSPTISGSELVDANGSYTWGSTPQMVADVQAWLDAPLQDHGWLLLGNEAAAKTAKRFDSRENLTESNRPVLKVYYTMSTPFPLFLM